jgi:protein O-mannosyl-transferase
MKKDVRKKKGQPERRDNTPVFLSILLFAICIALYANTYNNQYCLDDAMMITENSITQKGYAGIKDHLSHSFLYGYINRDDNNAASSRWRPLSLITYSMEVGAWGKNHPEKSHMINILLYAAIVLLLFKLLNKYWLKNTWLAFFAALLFAVHPVHTEVVANIKGRDELLSLFFVLLSLLKLWKYIQTKKVFPLVLSILYFFISLTAKESGITLIAGIPLALYFFTSLKWKTIASYSAAFFGVAVLYVLVRHAIVPLSGLKQSEVIMNNPFLYATGLEAICTKLYVMLLYLKLLVFPHPLVYDYSYNQIPYVNQTNIWVWISVAIYLGLFIYALTGIRKKSIVSFSILMFFITFSISTNLVIEIGTLMGERLLFLPSVFACIFFAAIGKKFVEFAEQSMNMRRVTTISVIMIPLLLVSSIKTIARNKEWKNDITLNLADVLKSPGSAKVNSGAGGACISLAYLEPSPSIVKDTLLDASLRYYQKTLDIFPGYDDAYLNMGIAYSMMNDVAEAEEQWKEFRKRAPSHPKLLECDQYLAFQYYTKGENMITQSSYDSAIYYLEKAATYAHMQDSVHLGSLYDLGGMYYLKKDYQRSYETLKKLEQIRPNYRELAKGIDANEQMLGLKKDSAIIRDSIPSIK